MDNTDTQQHEDREMNTKELILQASLCLFNQEGYEVTSARQIARVVRISQGNLRYHFASKEAIGQQLFEDFYQQYRAVLAPFAKEDVACRIGRVIDAYRELFALYYEYRFVLQDLWSLTRSLPKIKKVLQQDYQDRRAAFSNLLTGLAAAGDLEILDQSYLFDRIIYLQIFVGDYWMAHSGIYFEEDLQEEIQHYLEHWVMLLLPYLTSQGLQALMTYHREQPDLFFNEFEQLIQFHLKRRSDHADFPTQTT